MKDNFIKFRKESVQLAKIFASAKGTTFDAVDISVGTLVVGTFSNGKYIAMGWLRGMTQDTTTGKVLYEVVNAVQDEFTGCIEDARRVDQNSVPAEMSPASKVVPHAEAKTFASCTDSLRNLIKLSFIDYPLLDFELMAHHSS